MALFNKKVGKKDEEESKLVDKVKKLYRDSYDSKSPFHDKWDECFKAHAGTLFEGKRPDYAVEQNSNYIFATVETVKPIMLSQIPKIVALPKQQEHFEKAEAIQQAIDYEWKRSKMFPKLQTALTTGLVTGTVIMSLVWDGEQDGIGQIKPVVISPFNFFIDSMATTIDEAEFAGYAAYMNVGQVIQFAPEKEEELRAATEAPEDNWLTYNKDTSNQGGNQSILYIEMYFRDYSTIMEEETDEDGKKYKVTKMKYPQGRRTIIAGDVVLDDGPNPYEDGKFPFVSWKCYDVPGRFWGMGEVEHIISPQKYANEVVNVILDSARLMSNQVWVMDKNSGVAKNSLSNRMGLIVRKNPGTTVERLSPPPMPAYLQNIATLMRQDVEHISGVYDVTRGERPSGITAASAIQALTEQAQGRIKLKVQALEEMLSELGCMWVNRIRQFWQTERNIRILGEDYKPTFVGVDKEMVDGDWDIVVVAGATMPVNKAARFQQLIQLAQTQAEDQLPMVDRKTLLENSEIPDVKAILQRFDEIKQGQQQQQEQAQQQAMQAQQEQNAIQMQEKQLELQQKAELEMTKATMKQEAEERKLAMTHEMQLQDGQMEEEKANSEEQQAQVMELIEMIQEMTPEQLAQFVQEHPEVQELLDILSQVE